MNLTGIAFPDFKRFKLNDYCEKKPKKCFICPILDFTGLSFGLWVRHRKFEEQILNLTDIIRELEEFNNYKAKIINRTMEWKGETFQQFFYPIKMVKKWINKELTCPRKYDIQTVIANCGGIFKDMSAEKIIKICRLLDNLEEDDMTKDKIYIRLKNTIDDIDDNIINQIIDICLNERQRARKEKKAERPISYLIKVRQMLDECIPMLHDLKKAIRNKRVDGIVRNYDIWLRNKKIFVDLRHELNIKLRTIEEEINNVKNNAFQKNDKNIFPDEDNFEITLTENISNSANKAKVFRNSDLKFCK